MGRALAENYLGRTNLGMPFMRIARQAGVVGTSADFERSNEHAARLRKLAEQEEQDKRKKDFLASIRKIAEHAEVALIQVPEVASEEEMLEEMGALAVEHTAEAPELASV